MANHCEGLIAQPDGSLMPGRVRFADRIIAVEPLSAAPTDYVLPGFIDLQVNGACGLDVMSANVEELLTIAHVLAHEGTTGWLPTAITAPWERIERIDAVVTEAMAAQEHGAEHKGGAGRGTRGATILGTHLEGPFISPSRLGVHPKANQSPDDVALDRMLTLESVRLMTLAPELEGALAAIRRLNADRVAVSMGHSEASLEQAGAGIEAGARMFTHLFNAMRPLHHRSPGIISAALAPSPAYAALIPDGVHVHPHVIRMVWRLRGAHGIVLTTDRVALAGADGTVPAMFGGGLHAQVRDGAARLADGTLAGSIITMLEGARLMVERVGATVGEVALMASTNPARILGRKTLGRLSQGATADLIVLDRELKLKAVFVWGREID
ncbi:MAG: N-acetylglucosamine-6-phosphate deacetylase [Candidatus Binataceae bacterium]